MLLNFTVGNWMSYRDEASLNMIASRERQHAETLVKLPTFRNKKVLPVAAIYGGNASGKTALFNGLAVLKHMVTGECGMDELLPINPFILEEGWKENPTVFDVTFLAGETVYRYVVEATLDGITYESLERVREKGSTDIFVRDEDAKDKKYTFDEGILGSSDFLEFVAKSTRRNQTFLGRAVAQNVEALREPYDWFDITLQLVGVESHAWTFANAAEGQEGFLEYAGDILSRLDTGICGLTGEPVDLDVLPADARLRRDIANLDDDELLTVVIERAAGDYGFDMITVQMMQGLPVAKRLLTKHRGSDGKTHRFTLGMESSGTQRLMGLLPMFFELEASEKRATSRVYIVDELDRCLHTMLTTRLVEDFLATCTPQTRKQLLFTTHDLLLMNQSLMRRDEMYIAQRDVAGKSELVGLTEFNGIRFDKDLIRSYLEGRFGGIPMLDERGSRG